MARDSRNMVVCCIYDSKAEAYLLPMFFRTTGEAIRGFSAAVNDPQSNYFKFPGDFTLFHVGEYDELEGVLIPAKAHFSLGKAVDFLKSPDGTSER